MTGRPPLQNRVDPWAQLHAVPARGGLMGNRGVLHEGQTIVRVWNSHAWVTCVLDATFQKRSPFSPGTYSERFFLDEATSFAAGHRPCRVCQRQRHDAFNVAWTAANEAGSQGGRLPIAEIDKVLHAERTRPDRNKRTYRATAAELPPGTFFEHAGQARLVWTAGHLVWSFQGYRRAEPIDPEHEVEVLTPRSIVQLFAAGFRPRVHASADAP